MSVVSPLVAMPLQPANSIRKLSKLLLATLILALCSNGAAAATTQPAIGAGSLDDWLALGLALLAALYCVQKRE